MSSVNKTELAGRLAARIGTSKARAEEMVDETLAEIGNALTQGHSVTLHGFGRFRLARQEPRGGVVNGREYIAPAKTVVRFRSGKALAEACAVLDLPH